MKVLILAGGSGTRLWPLSRTNYPKQFLRLGDNKSLLQQAVERLAGIVSPPEIIVITNDRYKFHVKSDLFSLLTGESIMSRTDKSDAKVSLPHLILEPVGRNTAPAIAVGVKYCSEMLKCDNNEVICVLPSDHIIRPAQRFQEYLLQAEEIAKKDWIVTFGIKPIRPDTGYGYMKSGEKLHLANGKIEAYRVESFVEKPDRDTALYYLGEGNYCWNSGMFAFTIGTITEEFNRYIS